MWDEISYRFAMLHILVVALPAPLAIQYYESVTDMELINLHGFSLPLLLNRSPYHNDVILKNVSAINFIFSLWFAHFNGAGGVSKARRHLAGGFWRGAWL